jgi:hypothetical protein
MLDLQREPFDVPWHYVLQQLGVVYHNGEHVCNSAFFAFFWFYSDYLFSDDC